ncbi:Strongly-conserved Zn-finger binding protein (TFIIIA) [Dissophora globulifera]|nr:Strongly-conserved Zn-finger binding protein (TFIIIA) [Dissophora globulifera]
MSLSILTREDHLVIHTKIHGADREFQCEQPGCSKAFYTKSKLLRHLKSHSYIVSTPLGLTTAAATSTVSSSSDAQSDDLSLWSDGKGRQSRRSSLSAEALQRVAGQLEKEKPHMCTWEGCTQRFSQRKKLRAHICVAHEGRKPYPYALRYCCGIPGCGKFFSKWSMLQKHTKECHKSMPCAACGKMILKRNLNAHMKIHDASRLERTLATHLQKAHDTSSDSPPTFTCEYEGCGMGFQYKHVLKRHIDRVHEKPKQRKKVSDEVDFEDVLDDMFGFAEADISIRTPFACPIPGCERRFTSERLMKRHLQGQEHRSGKVTGADIVQSLEDDENQAIRDMIDMHLGRNSGSNSTTS